MSKKTLTEYGTAILLIMWMAWTTMQIFEHRQTLKEMGA